jgi:hypothetical protein
MKGKAFVNDDCGNSWVCICRSMKRYEEDEPVEERTRS